MTLFEHTVPPFFLAAALVLALAAGVFSAWRYLPKNRGTLTLLALYAAALLALAWCLLLPGRKDTVTQLLKPRFLIALDTSRSMSQSPPGAPDGNAILAKADDNADLLWRNFSSKRWPNTASPAGTRLSSTLSLSG